MSLLIFCADRQRSESLGPSGHQLTSLPNYSRLASDATLFERAFCRSVLCTPSRALLLDVPGRWHSATPPAVSREDLPRYPAFHSLVPEYRHLNRLDEEPFRKINAVYLGMNDYVDMLFGRLMDALENAGHAGNTTIIVMSDHGDFAGAASDSPWVLSTFPPRSQSSPR